MNGDSISGSNSFIDMELVLDPILLLNPGRHFIPVHDRLAVDERIQVREKDIALKVSINPRQVNPLARLGADCIRINLLTADQENPFNLLIGLQCQQTGMQRREQEISSHWNFSVRLRDKMTLTLSPSGRYFAGIDSHVFRPMTTAFFFPLSSVSLVIRVKKAISFFNPRHGSDPFDPIPFERQAAAMAATCFVMLQPAREERATRATGVDCVLAAVTSEMLRTAAAAFEMLPSHDDVRSEAAVSAIDDSLPSHPLRQHHLLVCRFVSDCPLCLPLPVRQRIPGTTERLGAAWERRRTEEVKEKDYLCQNRGERVIGERE